MKILSIRTQLLEAPLKTPFVTALRRVESLRDVVVTITCDNGMIGYGEGAPTPQITGETVGSMRAAVDFIAPLLTGKEMVDFPQLISTLHKAIVRNTTAKAALEIALYDLKSQMENQPLYKMLGGTQTAFTTDITISMNDTMTMIADAQEAYAKGYEILKIKIGDDPQKDAARIIEIDRALEGKATLRLDANQGWSARESVALLQRIEDAGIRSQFIEQPVPADDIEGLKYIRSRVETPLLADESVFSLKDARILLEMEAVDYLNIKLAKTGGISQALALADLTELFGVKCMIGCMLEGPLSVAAGVHVASSRAETITMLDLDAVALLASHPAKGDICFDESQITLGEEPGLGMRL
jgi:o-succinylbenzoate synthase